MTKAIIQQETPYAQLLEPFLSAQDVGKRTLEAYKANIERFFFFLVQNNVDTRDLSKKTIIEYKNTLINEGKKPATINAYLTAVKRLFEWLESEGAIKKNFAKYVKSVKTGRDHKRLPLLPIQWEMLRESLSSDDLTTRRDLMIIALGYGAGLRTVEITRVQVEDLQFIHNHWVLMIEGKGSRAGEKKPVVIDNLMPVLRSYIQARGINSGLLFTSFSNNNSKKQLTTAGLRHIIKKRFNSVGIDNPLITAHSLRHGFAVAMLEAGASVEEIQVAMRHDSIESTMIYLRARDMYKNPASNRIDIFGAKSA